MALILILRDVRDLNYISYFIYIYIRIIIIKRAVKVFPALPAWLHIIVWDIKTITQKQSYENRS